MANTGSNSATVTSTVTNLRDQGYPSSMDGYTAPTNLTSRGYPSSTDGMNYSTGTIVETTIPNTSYSKPAIDGVPIPETKQGGLTEDKGLTSADIPSISDTETTTGDNTGTGTTTTTGTNDTSNSNNQTSENNTANTTNQTSETSNIVPTNTNNYDSYSSISDIYINYTAYKEFQNALSDASANIKSDINKVEELLQDLNLNWKSDLSTQCTKLLEEYMDYFLEYSQFYKNMSDLIQQSGTAYSNFDEHFQNEII